MSSDGDSFSVGFQVGFNDKNEGLLKIDITWYVIYAFQKKMIKFTCLQVMWLASRFRSWLARDCRGEECMVYFLSTVSILQNDQNTICRKTLLFWPVTCWVWLCRNNILFQEEILRDLDIVGSIKMLSWEWFQAYFSSSLDPN